jgi:hypothetical protein
LADVSILNGSIARVARQLAIGDHRPGEGHRPDPDAEHQFDPQDADLDRRFLGDQLAKDDSAQ